MSEVDNTQIGFLLKYCSELPELYNSISNGLWVEFGITSAELSLLVTYFVNEDRKRNEEYRREKQMKTKALYRGLELTIYGFLGLYADCFIPEYGYRTKILLSDIEVVGL